MATLLLIIIPISLLDSMSMVPLCIVPLATILGGSRPALGASSFLAGIFVVYAGGGILLLVVLDALFYALGPVLDVRQTVSCSRLSLLRLESHAIVGYLQL